MRERRQRYKTLYEGKTAEIQKPGRKKKEEKVESWGDAKVNC